MSVVIIVALAILLHWLVAGMASATWVLNGIVTGVAVSLIYLDKRKPRQVTSLTVGQEAVHTYEIECLLIKLHPRFSAHFSDVNEDLAQVQNLLGDIIEQLLKSFSGMHSLIEAQRDIVNQLTQNVEQDSVRVNQLNETAEILKNVVSEIINNSKAVEQRVGNMESLSAQLEGVLDVLGEIDAISRQTEQLVSNVPLEAARAAKSGREFAGATEEIGKLSARSEHFTNQIRKYVSQMHEVVGETEGFISNMAHMDTQSLLASKSRLDDSMMQSQEYSRMRVALIAKQEDISAKVDSLVGAAVISLQFQDSVGQMLGYSRMRLDCMHTAWQRIESMAQRAQTGVRLSQAEVERENQEITRVFEAVDQLSAHNPVCQDTFESSKIELF